MRLFRRLAYWLRLSTHHTDLMDELALHRDLLERDLIRQGMSPDAARAQARRTMGNEAFMREEARAVWLRPSLEALVQDATHTLRDLRRNPTFTIGVVLTLALGIGANAAMFSLVDRLFFRPPARMVAPETVHRVYLYRTVQGQERETGGIYARYADLERWSTSFSQTAGIVLRTLPVGVEDQARLRDVAIVSAGFFGFFDAPPLIGRYFTAAEDVPPVPSPVVVLSHTLWKTQFNSRSDILGSTLHIGAAVYTIIGVAPDGFVGVWPYQPPAAFIPATAFAASRGNPEWATTYGTAFGLGIIVRRKPGVTIAAANADLTNALRQSYQAQLDTDPRTRPLSELRPRAVAGSVLTERGPDPSSLTRIATWLNAVTLIVLLIACANVANLLLARTIRRRREIAVRVALGGSRSRLFRQLLTEGVLLGLLGGGVSLLFARWGSSLLQAVYLPGSAHVALITDARTLLFSGAIALGVGLFAGLVPMVEVARGTLTADLKSAARGTYHRRRLRPSLVVLQCALSAVLLVGAGLFVQSLRHVRHVPLGFDPDSVLVVSLDMRDGRRDSAAMAALRLRLLESVVQAPGVSFATLQESIPFAGSSSWPIFVSAADPDGRPGEFYVNTVSPDYFRVMGTRLLSGRAIEGTDVDGAPRVAVVSASMADALWHGVDPIGQCFRVAADTMPCTYVVGVAEDIRAQSIDGDAKAFFYYLPAAQWHPEDGGLFLRVRGDARGLVESVRKHLQREMPGTSFVTVTPLADVVDATLRSWIVGAKVYTVFGALALVLAGVGLYSVIAYGVTQRQHELGVRLALGAARAGIVRVVVMEGLGLALVGVAIGGAVAFAAGRWIGPLLFQQSPYDLRVLAVVSVLLIAVAFAAGCLPAFRAARVDPKTVLQAD